MAATVRFTSRDLELMPDDGKRYEVIDGELYVAKAPGWEHQYTCLRTASLLDAWSRETGAGHTNAGPGIIFAEDDDVIPDVVWVSKERLPVVLGDDRKLHAAPELVVEVLSPGWNNEQRDREAKLKLYSRRGVLEYWILDWQRRQVEVYRREAGALRLVTTLNARETLNSPLLPGFACPVTDLFMPE
jgi:Uma2 family endonuclease